MIFDNVYIVLPARKNSKRLPKKYHLLYSYTMETIPKELIEERFRKTIPNIYHIGESEFFGQINGIKKIDVNEI